MAVDPQGAVDTEPQLGVTSRGRPAGGAAVLQRHQGRVAERIAGARPALAVVERALVCERDDLTACLDFRAVLAERIGPVES